MIFFCPCIVEKIVFVFIISRKDYIILSYLILNNQAIAEKEFVKYLGVIIDPKLSFQQHITIISKKNL